MGDPNSRDQKRTLQEQIEHDLKGVRAELNVFSHLLNDLKVDTEKELKILDKKVTILHSKIATVTSLDEKVTTIFRWVRFMVQAFVTAVIGALVLYFIKV